MSPLADRVFKQRGGPQDLVQRDDEPAGAFACALQLESSANAGPASDKPRTKAAPDALNHPVRACAPGSAA